MDCDAWGNGAAAPRFAARRRGGGNCLWRTCVAEGKQTGCNPSPGVAPVCAPRRAVPRDPARSRASRMPVARGWVWGVLRVGCVSAKSGEGGGAFWSNRQRTALSCAAAPRARAARRGAARQLPTRRGLLPATCRPGVLPAWGARRRGTATLRRMGGHQPSTSAETKRGARERGRALLARPCAACTPLSPRIDHPC